MLLVSHSCLITALFAEGVDPHTHQFIESRRFENCEVVPFSFSKQHLPKKQVPVDFSKLDIKLSKPNNDFFKRYAAKPYKKGEVSEIERSQLLVVRHAYSAFNHEYSVYAESKDQSYESFMKCWAGEHLLDAQLHP